MTNGIKAVMKKIYKTMISKVIREKIFELLQGDQLPTITSKAVSNEMEFDVVANKFWSWFNSGKYGVGIWEPETREFYKEFVSPVKDIIDIGGWIGPTVLIAYSYNPKKIYVVEADTVNYQILKMNVMKNYLQDKVELYNICISDETNNIVNFGYIDEKVKNTSTNAILTGGGG
jgi:hypothetical protein